MTVENLHQRVGRIMRQHNVSEEQAVAVAKSEMNLELAIHMKTCCGVETVHEN